MEPKFDEIKTLMKQAGDESNIAVASKAKADIGMAVAESFKEALFPDDFYSDLFTVEYHDENKDIRYPTDIIQAGRESEFKAYHAPRLGAPAERITEQDYIHVSTMDYVNNLEIPLPALKQGDFNALQRAIQTLWDGVTYTFNDTCFHVLIAAAAGRGFQVADPGNNSKLSKNMIPKMQTKARRQSNASSSKSFRVTRVYMSPELRETITEWDNADVDEWTRREIVMAEDGKIGGLYGCEIVEMDEFGANQDYQSYAVNTHSFTFTGSRTELVLGVDTRASKKNKFVLPICGKPELNDDSFMYKRRNLAAWHLRLNFGAALLDDRAVLFGEC